MLQRLQLDWAIHPKATPQAWLGLHGPYFSSNSFFWGGGGGGGGGGRGARRWCVLGGGGLRARPAVTYLFFCNDDI